MPEVFSSVVSGRIMNSWNSGDTATFLFNYLVYENSFGSKSQYKDHPCNMANNS